MQSHFDDWIVDIGSWRPGPIDEGEWRVPYFCHQAEATEEAQRHRLDSSLAMEVAKQLPNPHFGRQFESVRTTSCISNWALCLAGGQNLLKKLNNIIWACSLATCLIPTACTMHASQNAHCVMHSQKTSAARLIVHCIMHLRNVHYVMHAQNTSAAQTPVHCSMPEDFAQLPTSLLLVPWHA